MSDARESRRQLITATAIWFLIALLGVVVAIITAVDRASAGLLTGTPAAAGLAILVASKVLEGRRSQRRALIAGLGTFAGTLCLVWVIVALQ
ncbi:MAG: hypothetical protein IPO80_13375 [Propionibacteriaceae bacterium]|nr:hypothetical protein [Propionibacteriaceae bacterium]